MKKNVNNKFLRIGFDFDGVIIDHTNNKIQKAREFGFSIEPYQTPSNRLKKIIKQPYYSQIQEYIYGPGTAQAPMIQKADRALNIIKNSGHEMFIVSAREPRFQVHALKWLEKYMPGIFKKQNIMLTINEGEKDSICKRLNVHIYIDDKISVLENIKSVDKKFLYDPYNIREDFELRNIQPVSSWDEFLQLVLKQS